MRPSNSRQILELCFRTLRQVAHVGAAVLIGFSATGSAHAQTLTGTDVHLTSNAPRILLEDNFGTTYQWQVNGSSGGFDVTDITNSSAVPFKIDTGAPTNSIRVLQSGYVGFGKYPAINLHVFTGSVFPPALRLENTNFAGTRAWDLRGGIGSFDLVDVTNSSATPFGVKAGAPTNSLFVTANGSIGMGTATPDANSRLDIRSTLTNGLMLKNSAATPHYLRIENSAGVFRTGVQGNGHAQFGMLTPGKGLFLTAGGTGKMEINASGQFSFGNPPPPITTDAMITSTGARLTTGGVWTDNSSRATKQDIEPITSDEAREAVRALQPVGYRYKNELDERYVGFIADDVPELVATRDRKGLAPMDIVAVLTKVVQDQDQQLEVERKLTAEQRRELAKQQQINARQEKLLEALSQRLADLEQKLGGNADASE